MTRIGKCDTCRQRKIKCDEGKPKCGACQHYDRPCAYSYGKASAFVVQDPKQLTKHGKSKVAPLIYTLKSPRDNISSSPAVPCDLQLTHGKVAADGMGFFQTLAPVKTSVSIRNAEAYQRRKLKAHLRNLQQETLLASHRLSSSETMMIARYIDILGTAPSQHQPLSIFGTWIQSIPSRVGSSRVLDTAVEFLVNSFEVCWDKTHSKRCLALATKDKALKELQLSVLRTKDHPTYDILLATKLHCAAEVLLGIETMHYTIHALALGDMLQTGVVSGVDDEHFWSLFDSTYIDDITAAITAGRTSMYDNDYYLSATHPLALSHSSLPFTQSQKVSRVMMHIFIQCPRLALLMRLAAANPHDKHAHASAISLAESIWQLSLAGHFSDFIQSSVVIVDKPSTTVISDILPHSLQFNSIENMILCTRYWMLQNILCGLTDTMYRKFPEEVACSLLPGPDIVRRIDLDAAVQLARFMSWLVPVSSLQPPLMLLQLYGPLMISIGSWQRTIRCVSTHGPTNVLSSNSSPESSDQISQAKRMSGWLMDESNRIHKSLGITPVDEKAWLEVLEGMAGEEIPDWLPTKVRFAAEDGDMVMKLDYEQRTVVHQHEIALGADSSRTLSIKDPSRFGMHDLRRWIRGTQAEDHVVRQV